MADRIYPYTKEPPLTAEESAYIEPKIGAALELLARAVEEFKPRDVIGLLSGGDDSAPACYIASLHPLFKGALHIDTGIGIQQTRDHVSSVCKQRKWSLAVMRAVDYVDAKGQSHPAIYEEICKFLGFPGPAQHGLMYQRLKERQLSMFERQQGYGPKPGERVLYVSGVRSQESNRRKKNTTGKPVRKGRTIWAAPIYDWSKKDCQLCRRYAGIKRNPVAELIHKSGECLCGAFAEKGELAELAVWFPEVAQRIRNLEAEVRAAGFPWGWEDEPPDWWLAHKRDLATGQGLIFQPEFESTAVEDQILCTKCNLKNPLKYGL